MTVTHRCSTLYPNFRSRVYIIRKCNYDGTWGSVDDRGCTALDSAIPIIIVSFEVNTTKFDAQQVVENVSYNILYVYNKY